MKQEEVHIEDLHELVKFVFSDNMNNNKMVIESGDFKDTRDLYFFCIELTMKGLAYLYGNEDGKVDIEDLTFEELQNIKNKLRNAAIELMIDIEPISIDTLDTEIIYNIPYKDIEKESKLEEYSLKLIKKKNLYNIRFKIMDYI
mgnify:FL=1